MEVTFRQKTPKESIVAANDTEVEYASPDEPERARHESYQTTKL